MSVPLLRGKFWFNSKCFQDSNSSLLENRIQNINNNQTNIIILFIITIGIASYIYWDIHTQNIIYSTAILFYDNITSFFHFDGSDNISSSSSSNSSSSISSNNTSRTVTPSNYHNSVLDTSTPTPIPQIEIDINTLISKTEIPEDSIILENNNNHLTFKTPDNKLFLLERSTSPSGSVTHFKYELDKNNNYSKTEILTIQSDRRLESSHP